MALQGVHADKVVTHKVEDDGIALPLEPLPLRIHGDAARSGGASQVCDGGRRRWSAVGPSSWRFGIRVDV